MTTEFQPQPIASVKLNCDLAEVDQIDRNSAEHQVMPIIDMANIACAAHAGNQQVIKETIRLAKTNNTEIGAHPSYPDRENFGRKSLKIDKESLSSNLFEQIQLVIDVATKEAADVTYVKPHGALYNDLLNDQAIAKTVFQCVAKVNKQFDKSLSLMLNVFVPDYINHLANEFNIQVLKEAFADRCYQSNGKLTARKYDDGSTNPSAVLSADDALFQALSICEHKTILDEHGFPIKVDADTLCVHGDNKAAVRLTHAIRAALDSPIQFARVGLNALKLTKRTSADSLSIAQLAEVLSSIINRDVVAIIPAFDSIVIEFEHRPAEFLKLIDQILTAVSSLEVAHQRKDTGRIDSKSQKSVTGIKRNKIILPVRYDEQGDNDLVGIAEHLKRPIKDIVALHSQATYRVEAIGFAPGFAYLSGLPKELHLARKSTPRTQVPKGSVAIAEGLTSVYPQSSPGGWNLLGLCPTNLFNPNNEAQPCPFNIGDEVAFEAIDEKEYLTFLEQTQDSETRNEPTARVTENTSSEQEILALKITKPAPQMLIQDNGRKNVAQFGLTNGGALDKMAYYWSNHILGNPADSAVIEILFGNCEFVALSNTAICLTGAQTKLSVNDKSAESWRVIQIKKGDKVSISYVSKGLRIYLALQGGIVAPKYWNSSATVPREEIGTELTELDVIKTNHDEMRLAESKRETDIRGLSPQHIPNYSDHLSINITLDNQFLDFEHASLKQLNNAEFVVAPNSDRMGVRLKLVSDNDKRTELFSHSNSIQSEGITFGAIQVPPDGNPIILLADRQTIGGYPKLGTVIPSDCYRLAQAKPGTKISLKVISNQQAKAIESKFNQWKVFDNEP